MRTRCYVSDDGEVLSNKDYPVKKPTLLVPIITSPKVPAGAAVWVEWGEPPRVTITQRVYQAVTIETGEL